MLDSKPVTPRRVYLNHARCVHHLRSWNGAQRLQDDHEALVMEIKKKGSRIVVFVFCIPYIVLVPVYSKRGSGRGIPPRFHPPTFNYFLLFLSFNIKTPVTAYYW